MSQDMTQHQYSSECHGQDTGTGVEGLDEAAQLENDKHLIKTHPLFVLLELLFEKCERATRGEDNPTSLSFDDDIQEFVRREDFRMSPIIIDNPEIDNLMIKAIQVLRIHLLELEKVNELCKDFCHRYITCLKGKMHSENLLRTDMTGFVDPNTHSLVAQGNSQCMANTPNANVTVNQQGEIVMQGGLYQQSLSPNSQMLSQSDSGIDGSTPLSQVGVSPPSSQLQMLGTQQLFHLQHQPIPSCGLTDETSGRKTKRGVLPKQATEILRSWLFSHIVHPYPTEDEKRSLATQTNLTLLQVNNWFINARRRILQPMLDASNPDPSTPPAASPKIKKSKPQSARPTERFWPNSLSFNGGQRNEEPKDETSSRMSIERPSCAQQASKNEQSDQTLISDNFHPPTSDHSPPNNNTLGHRSPNHLHHYPHNDLALTSSASLGLSVGNN
uniref:Transcription factor protein n=1 Tax=Ciona intestinalis TaxID=7719 RepID=Q4H2X1_CIOIN|nr:transcription factor protein [Ciona intestinalis]BAE06656.1 transcription factor protein [Ciona intestinalis]|eukprot:NP_001071803.1 transcription factor protein [Ciona intestinalis]